MEYVVIGVVVVIGLLLFFIGGVMEEKNRLVRFRKRLYEDYGKASGKEYPEGRFQSIQGYHLRKRQDFYIDDITWNDLDMDKIFQKMDYSYSAAGEEYLYHMLRSPFMDKQGFEETEKYVSHFMEHADDRVKLQVLFAKIGRTGKYSIFDYLDSLDILPERKNFKHYIMILLIIVGIGICFVEPSIGTVVLFVCALSNIMGYFQDKKEVMPYITTFSYLLRLLNSVKEFEKLNLDILSEDTKEMVTCRENCSKFSKGSYMVTSMGNSGSNPLEIIGDYVKMIFHIDLIKFNQMLIEAKKHKKDFVKIFEITGKLESYISIGAYRKSLAYYAIPEFNREGMEICTELMYHPLVENPVANSFCEEGSMLLTGSNASGKSTFLKMVAINAILAQTIHTVTAKGYKAGMYRVYSSMSLRDDLSGGDSYFIVEIKALKRIADAMNGDGLPVLCFVDEVLRGTNTVERIAASCEILKKLNTGKNICFAATHDIELTELLKNEFHNYHFEETIENDDVLFNYKLMKGKARTRNAIMLLSILGFEKDIINSANKRAEKFINEGVWSV